jgi:hypothetical protein
VTHSNALSSSCQLSYTGHDPGLRVRSIMAISNGALVSSALLEGGKVTHCNSLSFCLNFHS